MQRPDPLRDVVLIVDDAPENLSILHTLLDKSGYTVLVATDGAGALDRARRLPPDLILLDAVMPGIDGFETCRQLKEDLQTRTIPVVFMTGYDEDVIPVDLNGIARVQKPADLRSIVNHLRPRDQVVQVR